MSGTNADDILDVFFPAMLKGYADPAGAHAQPILGLPGAKGFRFEKNGLVVVDYYFTYPRSDKSSGGTVIATQDGWTLWRMVYGGHYPKEAIPFLKRALWKAYHAGEFFGGRGLQSFEDGQYIYINNVRRNDPMDFDGGEIILKKGVGLIGAHSYSGMSLMP